MPNRHLPDSKLPQLMLQSFNLPLIFVGFCREIPYASKNLSNKYAFCIGLGMWIDPSLAERLQRPAPFHPPPKPRKIPSRLSKPDQVSRLISLLQSLSLVPPLQLTSMKMPTSMSLSTPNIMPMRTLILNSRAVSSFFKIPITMASTIKVLSSQITSRTLHLSFATMVAFSLAPHQTSGFESLEGILRGFGGDERELVFVIFLPSLEET